MARRSTRIAKAARRGRARTHHPRVSPHA